MRTSLSFFIILLFSLKITAQEKSPLLTGKVNISIKEGTFDCDLTLSDIPQIKDYVIRLNSGMNILHFRSRKPNDFVLAYEKSTSDSTSTGESLAYYFPKNKKEKFLPQSVQLKYTGKFPIARDTIENYTKDDWRGNIAFNYNSLRAEGTQAAWYPVLFDMAKDKKYDEVRYDIEFTCNDCSTLYVNGNPPVKARNNRFKSDVPYELAIFLGDYNYSNISNTYILNPQLTEEQIRQFSEMINTYKNYYTEKLDIPFGGPVTFVETTPTSLKNGWLFVSYPTIMNIGWGDNGLKSLFNPKTQNWFKPFIAHELGHYYFGTYKQFNSELGGIISESFSEFLSLKITKDVLGKEVYDNKIKGKIKNIKDFDAMPLSTIRTKPEDDDYIDYAYESTPILLAAIEKEIGEKQMWKWMSNILKTPSVFTNYQFLMSTLKTTLKDDKKYESIKTRYFEDSKHLQNAIKVLE
ncbi:MAG: hypothetical protein LBE92_09535 [Chryseobacterium sp.]|jgi:hypothetical protein|uniref:hypothetical protein n=1 Tax=Chryseobacterium sp. TaxID=1871047 RepID=UPI002836874A|nr:hypothetical protein [Chryseobacterium sp.]MDR2236355.1 hypothetical protein [Chryseobacterium sp.]